MSEQRQVPLSTPLRSSLLPSGAITIVVPSPSGNSLTANVVRAVAVSESSNSVRWQDVLGDISLSDFSDVNLSPNQSDVMKFVERQSSEIGSPPRPEASEDASNAPTTSTQRPNAPQSQHFFQFILMAPTSAAVPINMESLTYLNQNQSYEIKCTKLGVELERSRILRSVISLCFHNKRQLFEEQKLMDEWRGLHPGLKPIDVDEPMSSNVSQVKCSGNTIEFSWQSGKGASIFVKLSILSTDFTAKKHGGEKGVPFRLSMSTYNHSQTPPAHIHSSYAQVRVFRLKGADRKNKTDREKAERRIDRERFQPAYDYTILSETFPTDVNDLDIIAEAPSVSHDNDELNEASCSQPQPRVSSNDSHESSEGADEFFPYVPLPSEASHSATRVWLKRQRFSSHVNTFKHFSAKDLLRLSCEDLCKLCKVQSDAVRLYNSLHARSTKPKLVIYVKLPDESQVFTPLYLNELNAAEFGSKLVSLLNIGTPVSQILVSVSADVRVRVTDDMLQNLPNGCAFDLSTAASDGSSSPEVNVILRKVPCDADWFV